MRLITYHGPDGPRVAGMRDDQFIDLNHADPSVPACIKALLAQGPDGIGRAQAALASGKPIPLEGFRPAPLIPQPEKIICVGLNYADHAKETGRNLRPNQYCFANFLRPFAAICSRSCCPHQS